jgi:hypothetical protein
MSEATKTTISTTTPATTAPGSTGGTSITTRELQCRNTAEQEAIEDGDSRSTYEHKKKDTFKGKMDKMDGHVFQLAEESRKGNQFTTTLEALEDYTTIELDHAVDLAPLFQTPSSDVEITQPTDLAPMSSDGVNRVGRDHQLYIAWKYKCEHYNVRTTALKANKKKLFTIATMQPVHHWVQLC